jgi:thymidylate synthase
MIEHARQVAQKYSRSGYLEVGGSETDEEYLLLLSDVLLYGDVLMTRNAETISSLRTSPLTFTLTPLVTLRKTAWKMALREMEWFMSGDSRCPESLLPWWEKQLNQNGEYRSGYSEQYRFAEGESGSFDQIVFLLDSLKNHPASRRHLLTAWNPGDMERITTTNENPKTPTTCHSTMVQFFVRDGKLHAKHYQRSADLLLGVPHNWIQHWALMLYLAHHTGLQMGTLRWDFGDAHIYTDESHLKAVEEMLSVVGHPDSSAELVYQFSGEQDALGTPKFLASDFSLVGAVPEPATKIKPRLFE